MGIFYEEAMYRPQKSYTDAISINEMKEIVNENQELFREMLDMQVDQINMLLSESVFDDWKIKKEDLLNPEKLKSILKRIDKESSRPTAKDVILLIIAIFIYANLGALPGSIAYAVGLFSGHALLANVGYCAAVVGQYLFPILKLTKSGRKKTLLKKLDKAEKNITKYTENPDKYHLSEKEIKEYKKQLEVVHKAQREIEKSI